MSKEQKIELARESEKVKVGLRLPRKRVMKPGDSL